MKLSPLEITSTNSSIRCLPNLLSNKLRTFSAGKFDKIFIVKEISFQYWSIKFSLSLRAFLNPFQHPQISFSVLRGIKFGLTKPTYLAKEKTVKEIFALSGNLCALCLSKGKQTVLIDDKKHLITEIAHIRAQNKGGPRYDENYKDVDEANNLMALCCNCHKEIDKYPEKYSVEDLEKIKGNHEAKFTKAIRDLSTIKDVTKNNTPIYPKNLWKFFESEDDYSLSLKDFQNFIDKLKTLTIDCRDFLKICLERSKISSYCNGCRVLAEDINMVLQFSYKVKKLYDVCHEHGFIYDETDIENKYYLYLYFKTETHIDIFEGLKRFSGKYNISLDTFFDDLDFSSLDG